MRHDRGPSLSAVVLFLFLWTTTGFVLGTALLLGPVRWIATLSREHQCSPAIEKVAVVVAIAILFMFSAWLALRMCRFSLRATSKFARVCLSAAAGSLALTALWLWMNPALLRAGMGEVTESGPRFTFGPYPDAEMLRQLKLQGYTGVVSLLHPAVLPFEPILIAEERSAAAAAGLEFVHAPMLPWVSDNEASLRLVEDLVRNGTGRYYVHCYLGMDRVQLVRRVVELTDPGAAIEGEGLARSLRGAGPLERGEIYELEDGVFLGPYPTESEFLRFILPAGIRVIVCLFDPNDPEAALWIERERVLAERLHLPLEALPLPSRREPERIREATRRVRELARPVFVHGYLSPSTGRAPLSEAFMQAYRSDSKPIRVARGS